MADPTLPQLQQATAIPASTSIVPVTNPITPIQRVIDQLQNFPDADFNLTQDSLLVRFMQVLMGETGAGQLRKALIASRVATTLEGSHFFALDAFWGALFGMRRLSFENIDIDPATFTNTKEGWRQVRQADASYRSRIRQLAIAIGYGDSPLGMKLAAEALLSVPCDIYESYVESDLERKGRTWSEIMATYATWGAINGTSWLVLQGRQWDEVNEINLLTENQASLEIDLTGWTVGTGGLARSNQYSADGLWSMQLTAPSGGTVSATTTMRPCNALAQYTGIASFRSPGGTTRTVLLSFAWFDLNGNPVGTSTSDPGGTDSTSTFASHVYTVTSPAGAAQVEITVQGNSLAVNESLYVDEIGIFPGVVTTWVSPISPVNRRMFTVVPQRPPTLEESFDVISVLKQIKPAAALVEVSPGIEVHLPVTLSQVAADSEYWSLTRLVQNTVNGAVVPWPIPSFTPTEQPTPPWADYQGESIAWSPSGVMSYEMNASGHVTATNTMTLLHQSGFVSLSFPATQAMKSTFSGFISKANADGIVVSSTNGTLYAQGVPVNQLSTYLKTQVGAWDYYTKGQPYYSMFYWASPARSWNDPTQEALEIQFDQVKPVNNLDFDIAHFPVNISVQCHNEATGAWTEVWHGSIVDANPRFVPDSDSFQDMLLKTDWIVFRADFPAFYTRRVRIVQTRLGPKGPWYPDPNSLTDPADSKPYPVSVRNMGVGYLILTTNDLPDKPLTVPEIGSIVTYEVDTEPASNLLINKEWRCEPQPINYAVVNLYLDVRDQTGNGTLIDRFYVEPTYPGPHITVYWSNDDPAGTFEAANDPLAVPTQAHPVGLVVPDSDGLVLGSLSDTGYVDIDNSVIQFDPNANWWIGFDLTLNFAPGESNCTICDLGPIQVGIDNLSRLTASTPTITLVEDLEFLAGSDLKVALSYNNQTNTLWMGAVVDNGAEQDTQNSVVFGAPKPSTVRIGGYNTVPVVPPPPPGTPAVVAELPIQPPFAPAISVPEGGTESFVGGLFELPAELPWALPGIGEAGHPPPPATPAVSNFVLKDMVLKQGTTATATATGNVAPVTFPAAPMPADFVASPDTYVTRPVYASDTTHNTDNGILRYSPGFYDRSELGFLGGPGNFYPNLTWTPIPRDYILQKGYMQIPPTKARFFNFEFTNLVSEQVECLVPIERTVRLFPSSVVNQSFVPKANSDPGQGAVGNLTQQSLTGLSYVDAVNLLVRGAVNDTVTPTVPNTQGMVVVDPQQAATASEASWVFSFTPFSVGSTAPRWPAATTHDYAEAVVVHNSKTGFFVGLNQLVAYRLVYEADDDTLIYHDHFDDVANIQAGMLGWDQNPNQLTTDNLPLPAVTRSIVFSSTHNVKAVQYATVQSESLQLVPDDDFVNPALMNYNFADPNQWHVIGDALITYDPTLNSVFIKRDVEPIFEQSFFHVPGIVQPQVSPVFSSKTQQIEDVIAESLTYGGISTPELITSAGGFVWPAVRFTANTDITSANPLRLQLVAVEPVPTLQGPTRVQEAYAGPGGSGGATQSVSYPSATTTGNLLVAVVIHDDESGAHQAIPAMVTDSHENPWTLYSSASDHSDGLHYQIDVFYILSAPNITDTVMATPAPGGRVWGFYVAEIAPTADYIWAPDLGGTVKNIAGTSFAPSTGQACQAQDYVCTALATWNNPGTVTTPSGFSSRHVDTGDFIWVADLLGSGNVVEAPNWTTVSDPGSEVAVVAAFRQVAPVDPPVAVLAERTYTANAGQTIEDFFYYQVGSMAPASTPLEVQFLQKGKTNDSWTVDRLSLFDEGMLWEFSVDGGTTFYPAINIRNNSLGILEFPIPGNQLVWRLTGYRSNLQVNSLQIRPWYDGLLASRPVANIHGPNLSFYDHQLPIDQDPEFRLWDNVIPAWWFKANQPLPGFFIPGAPAMGEFNADFARPLTEMIPLISEVLSRGMSAGRAVPETAIGPVNLFALNDSNFENAAFSWAAGGTYAANTIAVQSSAWASEGSFSMAITSINPGNVEIGTQSFIQGLRASTAYSFMWTPRAQTATRSWQMRVEWYNGANGFISATTSTAQTDTTATHPGAMTFTNVTSPAGTANAKAYLIVNGLGASETHYVDQVAMFLGPLAITWAPGGSQAFQELTTGARSMTRSVTDTLAHPTESITVYVVLPPIRSSMVDRQVHDVFRTGSP